MGSRSRRRRRFGGGAAVLVLAMVGLACGSDAVAKPEEQGTTAPADTAQGDSERTEASDPPTGVAEEDGARTPEQANDDQTNGDGADGDETNDDEITADQFPDVIAASAERAGDGSWTFSATLSSPYDTPQRYADAWRVLGPDGQVYGIRELAHDHAAEQPFTRSQSGIVIPADVVTVTVEGRDQVNGWGGATVEVELSR